MLVLPATIIFSRKQQEKIKKYVAQGGVLVATFLTSVKNEDNVGYTDVLPAGLEEVFGSRVEEVEPVFDKNVNSIRLKIGSKAITTSDNAWSELLEGSSKSLGIYQEDYKKGHKVISENQYKKGKAFYIGTDMEQIAYMKLFTYIADMAFLKRIQIKREDKVEIVVRYLVNQEIIFVFNFTSHNSVIELMDSYADFFTKEKRHGKVDISRNETLVLYRETKE